MTAHDDPQPGPDEVVAPPPSGAIPPPPPAAQPPLAPPVGSDASAPSLPAGAPQPPYGAQPGAPQPPYGAHPGGAPAPHGAQPGYGAPAAPHPSQYQPPQGNGHPFQPPQYQPPQPYQPTPAYHPGAAAPAPGGASLSAVNGYPPASGGAYPPASGGSYPPGGNGYPAYPSAPSPTPRPKRSGLVIGLISLGAVVVIGGIVIAAVLLSNPGRPEAVPSPAATRSETAAPTPRPTPSSAPSSDPSDAPPATDPGSAEAVIQGKIDEYKAARQDGSLWERIPNTEFNQTAVSAFLYLLTDMKVATIWGGDASEYLGEVEELERKLLAGEPLGSDIRIVLEDRTFTYDGDTGEGGYTDN